MNIKEKTVFHICRHKELANILKKEKYSTLIDSL